MPRLPDRARFVEPMLALASGRLPEDPGWAYELKLDGYRALAIKTGGKVHLRSRNDKDFNSRYPAIAAALRALPDETIVDGEIVALDDAGRPSFNILQNHGSGKAPLYYYVFDVLMAGGRDVMSEPLVERRKILEQAVLPGIEEPVRYSPQFAAALGDLIESVRAQGLEGLVAKRLDSRYEPGRRSGAWRKMRVNRSQDFVIGGYTAGGTTFDALVFGYYENGRLLYAARTRNGFTASLREELFRRFRGLEIPRCPFANLPEARGGRWGQGLTAEKMKQCRWLKPVLVGRFEFVEWTPDNHLRHSRFIGLREDADPLAVGSERERRLKADRT